MFSERGFNFEREARLPDGDGGLHLVKARLSCSGAAGSHCCADCSHAYTANLKNLRGQDWVVHSAEAVPSDFAQYTDQGIWYSADNVATLAPPLRAKTRFQDGTTIWPKLRPRFNPVEHVPPNRFQAENLQLVRLDAQLAGKWGLRTTPDEHIRS
eukprot:7038919-Pyramimonas_sp.AAC.1